MKLYISDLHFYHEAMLNQLDNRNFPDVKAMNAYMLEKWNSKVQGGDQVIVLGDFFWSKDPSEVNYILKKLKGKICLIEGNHDSRWLKKEGVDLSRFEWIKPYAEFDDHGYSIVASHYPTFCYNHQFLTLPDGKTPRTYMLYGHVHNSHDEVLVNEFQNLTRRTLLKGEAGERQIPCQMINCFCMFSDYTPLSLEEWMEVDRVRREAMPQEIQSTIWDEIH
ncbi:MAG: metallophosphoesterase family protein [Spirochaetales bacterium]|nr:metallophosphoesterase family protein [Candidatus Physcosoma equi]